MPTVAVVNKTLTPHTLGVINKMYITKTKQKARRNEKLLFRLLTLVWSQFSVCLFVAFFLCIHRPELPFLSPITHTQTGETSERAKTVGLRKLRCNRTINAEDNEKKDTSAHTYTQEMEEMRKKRMRWKRIRRRIQTCEDLLSN